MQSSSGECFSAIWVITQVTIWDQRSNKANYGNCSRYTCNLVESPVFLSQSILKSGDYSVFLQKMIGISWIGVLIRCFCETVKSSPVELHYSLLGVSSNNVGKVTHHLHSSHCYAIHELNHLHT